MSGSGASSSSTWSSTPAASASVRRRASGSSTPSRPCVTTAALLTDCCCDPVIELFREVGVLCVDEVEDELMVPLGAGHARVYDPACDTSAREQRFGHVTDDPALHGGVAHDALSHLCASGLELRLHQHER